MSVIVILLLMYIMYRSFTIIFKTLSETLTDLAEVEQLRKAPVNEYLGKFYKLDESQRLNLFNAFQEKIDECLFKQLWTATHSEHLIIRAKNFQDWMFSDDLANEIGNFLNDLDIVVKNAVPVAAVQVAVPITSVMAPTPSATTATLDSVTASSTVDPAPALDAESVNTVDTVETVDAVYTVQNSVYTVQNSLYPEVHTKDIKDKKKKKVSKKTTLKVV